MKEFKSSIGNTISLFFFQTGLLLFLIYVALYIFTDFHLTQISFLGWLLFFSLYLIIMYLYAGFTNNDILVFDDRLEIVNRIPLFKKRRVFRFENINSIKFRHQWQETFGSNIQPTFLQYVIKFFPELFFPAHYKWIKIKANKEYKFYCFGIEMEYYENEKEPVFEDIFQLLSLKGLDVCWTNNTDKYYQSMNESALKKNES